MKLPNCLQSVGPWPYSRYNDFVVSLYAAAENWFRKRECEIHPKMPYCLARRDLWPQNIICGDVADYVRQEQKRRLGEDPFPLHRWLHHGLSSQAIEKLVYHGQMGGKAVFEHYDQSVFNEVNG